MTTAELFKDIQLLVLNVDGVMTDRRALQDERGKPRRNFSVRDSIGIRALIKSGVKVAIVSDSGSDVVRQHVRQLGVTDFFENCENKGAVIDRLGALYSLGLEQVAYISENIQDVALFARLRCAVTIDGADPSLRHHSRFVSTHRGGDGAVLEVCNLIMKANGRLRGSERARHQAGATTQASKI